MLCDGSSYTMLRMFNKTEFLTPRYVNYYGKYPLGINVHKHEVRAYKSGHNGTNSQFFQGFVMGVQRSSSMHILHDGSQHSTL